MGAVTKRQATQRQVRDKARHNATSPIRLRYIVFFLRLFAIFQKIGFPAVSHDSGTISVLSAPKLVEISRSGAMCRRVPFFTFFLRQSGGEKM